MAREETVKVRGKNGAAFSFSAGQKYGLKIAAGDRPRPHAEAGQQRRDRRDLREHGIELPGVVRSRRRAGKEEA